MMIKCEIVFKESGQRRGHKSKISLIMSSLWNVAAMSDLHFAKILWLIDSSAGNQHVTF